MKLLPLAIFAFSIASAAAISCNVASGTGVCAVTDMDASTDTCFQCFFEGGPSESSGCRSGASCNSTKLNCEVHGGTFSSCQTSACNACDSSTFANFTSTPNLVFFLSQTKSLSVFFYGGGRPPPLLCLQQPGWNQSFANVNLLPPTPFPFGSDPSVLSVLVWNNQNVFTFSSPDCSGTPRQPAQIIARPFNLIQSCFFESPSSQLLPPNTSLLLEYAPRDQLFLQRTLEIIAQLSSSRNVLLLSITSYPDAICGMRPLPPPPSPPSPITSATQSAIFVIAIFSDYLIPLLLLAVCCRSLLFRPAASRLTLPRFFRLWLSHSDLQDRYAAWFLTCTLNDFIVILIFNLAQASFSSLPDYFSSWFNSFPSAMAVRPLLVCVLFQPDRVISAIAVIEGSLLTATAVLRLQVLPEWMILPRIIFMLPPLMFTLTAAFATVHPSPLQINSKSGFAKKTFTRVILAVFGSSAPTMNFHHDRVAALVRALNQRVTAPISQRRLIAATTPMSARMLTVSYLAAFWLFFVSSFVFSGLLQLSVYLYGLGTNGILRNIVIACYIIFFVIFAGLFIYKLLKWFRKYRGKFVIVSSLCRRGLVPPGIQSHTNFQFAAKYISSETVRIVWNSVTEVAIQCAAPGVVMFLVAGVLFVVEYIYNVPIFNMLYIAFGTRFIESVLAFFVAAAELAPIIFILGLSNLLSNSWLSPFRLLRTQNLLTDAPKRVASCCCLKFRCVPRAAPATK